MYNLLDKYQVCYIEDEYIRNRFEGEARWIVKLNSGVTVYQDDDRLGVTPNSAWLRLRKYCQRTGDYPVGMTLQFRSHIEHLPENADGYYFVKSALGSFGSNKTYHFFIAGILENKIIKINEWKVPELQIYTSEERILKEDDECLIRKSI